VTFHAPTIDPLADVYSDQNDPQQAQQKRPTAIYEQLRDKIQAAVSRHSMARDQSGLA